MNFRFLPYAIFLISILCSPVFSQIEISVLETTKLMNKGEQPGLIVDIPQASTKNVERDWTKLMKKGSKAKVEKDKGHLYIEGVSLEAVAPDPINVYTQLLETGDGTRLTVFFEIYGSFLSKVEDEDKFTIAKKIVRNFGVEAYKSAVENELKEEEKKLKNFESELERLEKNNEKLHSEINENNRRISKSESEIETSEVDQERKSEQIRIQKDVIANMVNAQGDELKVAEKTLKSLEGDKRKLENDEESLHKKIEKYQSEIRQAERDIQKNLEDQENKRREIGNQKKVSLAVKDKLKNIQ